VSSQDPALARQEGRRSLSINWRSASKELMKEDIREFMEEFSKDLKSVKDLMGESFKELIEKRIITVVRAVWRA